MASIINFSGGPHNSFRLGLPHAGRWNEILNTDALQYGGSGVGNLGSVVAEEVPWHGQPYSALLTLPPLGAVWLEPAELEEPAGSPELEEPAGSPELAKTAGPPELAQTAGQAEPAAPNEAAAPDTTPEGER